MSNYTKTTNFAAKDSLPSGNANKIVKGTEIDTEFDNIATASATKADIAGPTFTGTVTIPTIDLNGGAIDGTTVGASTAAAITGTTIVANTSINIAGDGATVTGIKDEDDMSSNSATKLATQQSIKAYVDSQVTAQDLDFQADSGGALSIDLDSETLTFTGGTGVDTSGSGNAVTFAIDSTVTTLTGTQTLTNKTLTSPTLNTPTIGTSFTIGSATITEAELEILDGATVTTAELNVLDGITSTTAELNILDGVTSTAAELNILDGVTATAAELNYSDTGSSVGTVVASKVVTVDANKDVASFRNITLTGELDAGSLDISGDADIDGTLETDALSINGTAVTSTAAELNILDGVTSTAAELNILDGVTATTAELNYVDGVTSAIQTQLDAKAPIASPTFTGTVTTAAITGTSATFTSSVTATSLIASNGVLELDDNGSHNGVINVPASLFINIDSDNSATGEDFVISKDRTGTSGGTELFRVQEDGNVGIGMTPVVLLDIKEEASATDAVFGLTPGTGARAQIRASAQSDGTSSELSFLTMTGSSTSEAVRITGAGKVGIGNSSPNRMLTVGDNTQAIAALSLQSTTTGLSRIYMGDNSATSGEYAGLISYSHTDNAMQFWTSSNERMRIDSAGNVGINWSAPTSKLGIIASGSSNPGFTLTDGSTSDLNIYAGFTSGVLMMRTSAGVMAFGTTNTERMRIDTSGHITSLPTYNNGSASSANMVVNSSGLFLRSVSSAKYKRDIEDVQDAYVDSLLNIRPVYYRSTLENDNTEHSHWGFIAEEVAEIDPRLVHYKTVDITYSDDGERIETKLETPEPEGVQYDRFAPLMLRLIQKQQATITALEARITQLESN